MMDVQFEVYPIHFKILGSMRTPFTFEGFLVEICGNVTSCRWKSSVCVAVETEEKILQWVDNPG